MTKILSLTFLLHSILLLAQTSIKRVKDHQLKVNFILAPNIDYELGVSKHSTLHFQIGTQIGGVEDIETSKTHFGLFPSLKTSFRHYYNYNRRTNLEKTTANNSGNYYGVTTSLISAQPIIIANNVEVLDTYFYQIGGIYGLQRTYLKNLNLGAEFGIGYGRSESLGSRVIPIINFNLGWILL
jgi:hypothetical protein